MSRTKIKRSKKKAKAPKSIPRATQTNGTQERIDLPFEELQTILGKVQNLGLDKEDLDKLKGAVDTLAVMTAELDAKGATVRRLRRLIFGQSSEKTRDVMNRVGKGQDQEESSTDSPEKSSSPNSTDSDIESSSKEGEKDNDSSEPSKDSSGSSKNGKKKRKGHGRNGASDYKGAEKKKTSHSELKHKDRCPACESGKVYCMEKPAVLVRVTGMAPLMATVYEQERLRCNLCGEVFTAAAPDGVGDEKYDESVIAMIVLLKYGCGMPFNRLERLQASLGIPLPASTQWELVSLVVTFFMLVYTELIRLAAQGKLIHNDDTTARILDLEQQIAKEKEENPKARTGIFTSGIVSVEELHQIALFFTGRKHAGENLEEVLKHRAEELGLPIQMSDGSSNNTAGDFKTIHGECNAHARRKFVDVVENFPDEVEFVLKIYEKVYINDDHTKKQKMTDEERLAYHQENSEPLMTELQEWYQKQLAEKNMEPNSSLGEAIGYLDSHWDKLTLFLREPGAPLDNNLVERSLKRAILHRKNSLFFKTENGAQAGDIFMTIIHTCELEKINPFDYLVTLLKNKESVEKAPERWLPWNYKENLASSDAQSQPSK